MNRDWLPQCANVLEQVSAAESQASVPGKLAALTKIARCDLDFPATMRLDRAIRKTLAVGSHSDFASYQRVKLAILSTSTTSHLPAGIRVAGLGRKMLIETFEPDYGQFRQELMNPESDLHTFAPAAVLIAYDPYMVRALFGATIADADAAQQAVISVLDDIRDVWRRARQSWGAIVIQQLPLNPFPRLFGENEHRLYGSPAGLIERFQSAVREAAHEEKVDIIDLNYWTQRNGIDAWHSKALWHRAKQEVHPLITPLYGDLVARVLAARFGKSAKALVLDLDNTVWGGVIGDDGLNGIVIGQGSPVGEGHLAFQQFAGDLSKRGIILAVCSKNDEQVALQPFLTHPDMYLKAADIACFVANWTDKATNLRTIAATLNIGLDALVFADDNPFERNLVREEVPEVFVPEITDEASDYSQIISDSGYFEGVEITAEDLNKNQLYQRNAERKELLAAATDMESYLSALDMKLSYKSFDEIGLSRIVQLINKTNQFNLTTRRYTEEEVRNYISVGNFTCQLRLADRFGDNGMIAVIMGRAHPDRGIFDIDTWLMSCRVLGRNVERATLDIIVEFAKRAGLWAVTGTYIPSGRNGMVANHYSALGFESVGADGDKTLWRLDMSAYEPLPNFIIIEDLGND